MENMKIGVVYGYEQGFSIKRPTKVVLALTLTLSVLPTPIPTPGHLHESCPEKIQQKQYFTKTCRPHHNSYWYVLVLASTTLNATTNTLIYGPRTYYWQAKELDHARESKWISSALPYALPTLLIMSHSSFFWSLHMAPKR